MQSAAPRPAYFESSGEVCPEEWMSVQHSFSSKELEAELSTNGWTFFYMASPIQIRAFGFNPIKRMASALNKIVAIVRKQGCNSLQIDRVSTHSFFGLEYLSVSAHPRHIQKGILFVAQ